MKFNKRIIQYAAAAVVVMILGGFVGWFVFVRGQIRATSDIDSARGVGLEVSTGGELGSTHSNVSGAGPAQTGVPSEPGGAPQQTIGLWSRVKAFFGGSSTEPSSGTFSGGGGGGFGSGGFDPSVTGPSAAATSSPEASPAPKLWQITRTPVAGAGFAAASPSLFFAERASGNILRADPTRTEIERLTNTLFPKTIQATFAADGSVVLQSLGESGEIASFAGKIATSSSATAGDAPNKLEGVYLPRDIISLSSRSAPNTLLFLIPDTAGGSVAITSDWQGAKQKRVHSSALSGWRVILTADGTAYVLQKASDGTAGYFYRVLPSGTLERVVGDIPGLVALPKPGSKALLYSSSENGVLSLYSRTSQPSTDALLAIKTVAEKCVWAPGTALIAYCAVPGTAPSGSFLRNWYSGAEHTSDSWWRIDVSAGKVEKLQLPESSAFDAQEPIMDSSGSYIAFINGTDRTLWMLSLNR